MTSVAAFDKHQGRSSGTSAWRSSLLRERMPISDRILSLFMTFTVLSVERHRTKDR